jgi:type 1 glutamine amidotransferase
VAVAALALLAAGMLVRPEPMAARTPQAPTAGAPAGTPAVEGQAPAARRGGRGRRGGDPFAGQPRVRALVISGGCCHDYPTQNQVVVETLSRVLPVDWTVVYEGGTDRIGHQPTYANPDWAKGFDIVVHNECFGMNTDESLLRRIVEPHRNGIPAVVVHCSMHSYRTAANADVWREFVGVTSTRHTSAHRIAVKVTPGVDPLLAGWGADWTTPTDELYVIEKVWPGARPLATAVSPEAGRAEYPVIWLNNYQGARVFVTTLGHGPSWNDPVFQDLLVRGFHWALGRTPGAPGGPSAVPAQP